MLSCYITLFFMQMYHEISSSLFCSKWSDNQLKLLLSDFSLFEQKRGNKMTNISAFFTFEQRTCLFWCSTYMYCDPFAMTTYNRDKYQHVLMYGRLDVIRQSEYRPCTVLQPHELPIVKHFVSRILERLESNDLVCQLVDNSNLPLISCTTTGP